MNKLYWAKVKKQAIIPTKKEEDAGFDIYACSEYDITIHPNQVVLIPTGIASSFNSKYAGIIKERGSTGTKSMAVRAGVIDSGFRGEWKVAIQNTSSTTIIITDELDTHDGTNIYPKSKAIAQVVFQEVPKFEIETISYSGLKKIESSRMFDMLGDSNK